jgi:hypothetical protein
MKLDINIRYALRERERLESERRAITARIAVWARRCAALQAFEAALTNEELSQVSTARAQSRTRRGHLRTGERFLVVVETTKTKGGDDAKTKTTERALQSAR